MKKLFILLLITLLTTTSAFANDYKIDADHTTVGFRIKHLVISTVPGRFTDFSGTFSFDPTKVEQSTAQAQISTKSINTENKKRDDHLRSADFFDVSKYPDISFKTTKVEPTTKDTFNAQGELTIHGVTKPVSLNVSYHGSVKDPWGNERAAFTATTKINRKDFGLTWNKALETGGLLVGEDVEITIDVEGIKQPQV